MMFRKLMIALVLCGLTTGAVAQDAKMGGQETAGKKTTKKMPMRDAKGRFIKKDKMAAKTTAKMPERDAKGRFVKKGEADMKMKDKTSKKMPERDPKTGRFVKKK